MTENWRPITDYPAYEVSDLGRVRRVIKGRSGPSPAGKILSSKGLRNGYPSVDLCRDGTKRSFHVHRLVTEAFIGPCPAGQVANHLNADRTDNRAANLEYTTQSGNVQHAYDVGRSSAAGSKNGQAKLTEDDVRNIRASSDSNRVLANRYGVSTGAIADICSRRRWAHVGAEA